MRDPGTFARLALASALLSASADGRAASNVDTGSPGNLATSVDLQFNITIPRFVSLRVGSAASINTLSFAPTAAEMASSFPVLATGGDIGGSDVTVQVISNAGSVTLTAATLTADLVSGGNTMPWSTLAATNPTGSIIAPAFNTGSTVLTAVAGIVNQTGSWRYIWTNPPNTLYGAGTYTGTVRYTAATP